MRRREIESNLQYGEDTLPEPLLNACSIPCSTPCRIRYCAKDDSRMRSIMPSFETISEMVSGAYTSPLSSDMPAR